jgi:hypothetical protein
MQSTTVERHFPIMQVRIATVGAVKTSDATLQAQDVLMGSWPQFISE